MEKKGKKENKWHILSILSSFFESNSNQSPKCSNYVQLFAYYRAFKLAGVHGYGCLPADTTISTFQNGISGRPREFHLRIRLLVDFSGDRGDGISDCTDFSKRRYTYQIREPCCSIETLRTALQITRSR